MTGAGARVAVVVGTVLHSYTGGKSDLPARGATVDAVLDDLESRHAGLKWRVVDEQGRLRPHMALFVNGRVTRSLATKLADGDAVHVLQALSGG